MPENMLWEGIKALLPTIPVIIGGGWAWRLYKKERPHEARINFTVNAQVVATNDQCHIVDCVLTFENRGIIRTKVNSLSLEIRGVTAESSWENWKDHGNRLYFPHRIFKEENIIPRDWEHIFFGPSVVQEFRYTTLIPRDYKVVLVHGEFSHDNGDPHTAQKVFAPGSPSLIQPPTH